MSEDSWTVILALEDTWSLWSAPKKSGMVSSSKTRRASHKPRGHGRTGFAFKKLQARRMHRGTGNRAHGSTIPESMELCKPREDKTASHSGSNEASVPSQSILIAFYKEYLGYAVHSLSHCVVVKV